ncbi:MAG: prephenate dehydratase [Rikenellaceae bacterium]
MKQVTIQGEAGCFHEAAARGYFQGEQIETIPCQTFPSLFEAMEGDRSLIGIIAIENTIAGSLLQNHELLRASRLRVVGEHKIRISHVVAALPGQSLEQITEVNSHPIALRQCEVWLKEHRDKKVVEKDDTAGSAKEIAERGLLSNAAICGEYAAGLYNLNILERGVETNKHNFTRFLILADEELSSSLIEHDKVNKASLAFTLSHSSGSLSKVLTIFSFYDINLTKIQSMPIIGQEWEYRFYTDLTFDNHERYRQSIDAIRPLINDLKILGEYAEFTPEQ